MISYHGLFGTLASAIIVFKLATTAKHHMFESEGNISIKQFANLEKMYFIRFPKGLLGLT